MQMSRLLVASLLILSLARLSEAQVVRKGTLRAADRALIEAQAGAQAERWLLDALAPSGAVTRLVGTVELAGATPEDRVGDFLVRYGALFDAAPGGAIQLAAPRTLHVHSRGSRHLIVEQVVHGFTVSGHGLVVELDAEGRATCVHGVVSATAAALPAPTIDEARALAAAHEALAARGHAAADLRVQPAVSERLVDPLGRGLRLVIRVGAVLKDGVLPLAVDVDAHDGSVLAVFENTYEFGEGTFKYQGNIDVFKTGNGKGVVYKDFDKAAEGVSSTLALPELALETAVPILAEDGSLFGRFALVLNETPPVGDLFTISGFNHQFLGFPSDVNAEQADLFDATNCYFHITKFALGMTKLVGTTLPTDFAMPTLVNSPFELYNAFFSPQDLGLGTGPGFMVFGDTSYDTGFLADDLARDPTVMCHEYLHAIAEFSGLAFGLDPLNSPSRAVNEAIADYFAASFFKDARIGYPIAQIASDAFILAMGLTSTGGLRNLEAPKTMYDNLLDVLVDDVPEEHIAGHIFGCTLWQVRVVVKQKVADDLIFDSLFNWPFSLTELGYTEYGPANAVQAYTDFYQACLLQLVNDAIQKKGIKVATKVLGAAMRNGAIGLQELGTGAVLDLSQGGSVTLKSAFLGQSDGHLLGVALNGGQTFDLTLTGDKKDATQVALDVLGDPGSLTVVNLPEITDTSVKYKGIQVNQGGVFTIVITNDGIKSLDPHRYKLVVKAKP
jgi:hypothetical protein